ncbi:MAG TPA: hypothetical protein VHD90_07010, partial [Phototrophicaceae bacterium]|nr:hypothetical protein [Phototrophicaceae bacterium]
ADRPDSAPKAEMWYVLEQLEFDFVPLFGPQMRESWLSGKDLLLIPDGSAGEIVKGWQDSGRETWGAPGIPDGIGEEGLKAIRAFVEAGGAYLGLGSGGGILATAAYAGLIDLTVAHQGLGSGRAMVRITDAASPLVYGLDGSVAEDGTAQPALFPALYYSEGLTGGAGGPVFKAGAGAKAVALFDHIDYDPNLHVVLHPEYFDLKENAVAVAQQPYGKGTVTVLGVRPGFRAIWTHSEKLITNAIFEQVAEAASPITLA